MSEITKKRIAEIRASIKPRTIYTGKPPREIDELFAYIDSLTADCGLDTVGYLATIQKYGVVFHQSDPTELASTGDIIEEVCLKGPATAQINALKGERDELRETLRWYADPNNWIAPDDNHGNRVDPDAVKDRGSKARAALSAKKEGGE